MLENTKTEDRKQTNNSQIFWLIFALVVVISYLTGLTIPLLGPDEPRYSQVAREMFTRGDWITPTLGGFDWFEKPALLYWLQIASYKIFGVTEFAARFGSALFGLGTILALWILGKKWSVVGDRWSDENPKTEDRNPKAGNSEPTTDHRPPTTEFAGWLALVAASSLGLIVFSRGASFDIILTFPVTASLVAFFLFDQSEKKSGLTFYFPLFAFYFFIGVALIAKGLVGIVFPFGIVAFYYLLSLKLPSKTFIFGLFWGTILSLLVASIWYLPMYHVNGWKFVDEFFIQHHFQRYTSNKYLHPQPFYFFFWVLPLMTLPWLPFFFVAVWNFSKRIISRRTAGNAENGQNLEVSFASLRRFSVAWLLVPLVFFSVSGSKLPGYILPALPAALILTAIAVYQFVRKSRIRARIVKAVAIATIAGAALLAQFFVSDFLHEETVKHLIETADSKGYRTEKILGLHTVSHSAEFYGAGRLVRDSEGKQRRLYGVSEVIEEMKRENVNQILVLVPVVYQNQLMKSDQFESEILDDNGELAIAVVKLK